MIRELPIMVLRQGGEETIYEKYNKKYLEKKMNPYGDSKKDYSLIDWNDGNKKMGTS